MTPDDITPPSGMKAVSGDRDHDHDDADGPVAMLRRGAGPVMTEVPLSGTVPRYEPSSGVELSGDLYIRLEGQIYGPFRPDVMEDILQSGRLTGLEVASSDLKRWTPLAYHPRIVRGRVRDFDKAHAMLRDLSALPAKKQDFSQHLPLADVVKRPGRHRPPEGGVDPEDTPADHLGEA